MKMQLIMIRAEDANVWRVRLSVALHLATLIARVNVLEQMRQFTIPLVRIETDAHLGLMILVEHAILFVGAIVDLDAKLGVGLQNARLVLRHG